MKRILSAAIVLLMLLTLVGCASQNDDLNFSGGNSAILAPEVQNSGNGGENQQQNDAPAINQQPQTNGDSDESVSDSNNAGDQNADLNEDEKDPVDNNSQQEPENEPSAEGEKEPADQPEQENSKQEPSNEEKEEPKEEEPKEYPWITVCSYNVKKLLYDHMNKGNGAPLSKLNAVCAELRKINADIVGLQELERYSVDAGGADADQIKTLAETLGYPYYYFTKATTVSGGISEYGHGILSRYPIRESKDYHFYEFYCDASEPRAFSRSVLDVDGKELVFYNTHLAGPIPDQFDVITKMMAEDAQNGLCALVTGDMNIDPATLDPKRNGCILLNGVENPVRTAYEDGWLFPPCDNIVLNELLDYEWDDAKKTGITAVNTSASDHMPIYGKIRFKG